ncbi:MAG: DUF4446 family protein [Candidatus Vogelbacteria bacterium]|nr:DUF4446 family protein [Candidatus Vogelbacteria bacterium]
MVIDTSLALYILGAAIVIAVAMIIRLELRLRKLTSGKSGHNLEETIVALANSVKETDRVNEQIKRHLVGMEERLRRSIQHVKTVRFNPFREQGHGGPQSFATAFLDEQGNGAVVSSLHARDKVSVYAKPIVSYGSEYELSEEEKSALVK